MSQVNVYEAKARLSQLLEEVENGGEVVIARAGRPVARLVPFGAPAKRRVLGRDAGLLAVPDDFDAPLPPELRAAG